MEIKNGCLSINQTMLKPDEFLPPSAENAYPHLSFSYCSVPFIYQKDGKEGIEIWYSNGENEVLSTYKFSHLQSSLVFNRDARIQKIVV